MAESVIGLIPNFEPKKNNRWIVNFSPELGLENWVVQMIDRPVITAGYDGKITIKDINVTLIDPIGPSSSEKVYKCLMDKTIFSYTLEMLDPVNKGVEKWEMSDCIIKQADFGVLSYLDDRITTIKLIIEPRKFELKK